MGSLESEGRRVRFLRNNWYHIAGVVGVALAFLVGFFGDTLDPRRKILILNFVALLFHQYEEYVSPGGFPAAMNGMMAGSPELVNRYPLDKRTAFINNVFFVEGFYILSIVLAGSYWIGIMTIAIGLAQLPMHGILAPLKLKRLYNPGLATTVFLLVPIGIYYLWYLVHYAFVAAWQWWVGIAGMPVAGFVLILLPILIFRDKNSPYIWSQEELDRFRL